MELKCPLLLKDQVQRLITHGMIVENLEEAKTILSHVNYYRFTGYALQFRKSESDSDYKDCINWNKVYCIYKFDEELRNILRRYVEIVEVYYRTQIAYGFSTNKCMHIPHDQHYDERNFFNKKGYISVMNSFEKEKHYYKKSPIVEHHKKKYRNKMPLWVMVELMSFSNLSKLYSSMYHSEQISIANNVGTGHDMLANHLHCLAVLRNKCAHAARLYNTVFNPPAKFNTKFLKNNPQVKGNSLFAYILMLIKRLPTNEEKQSFVNSIEKLFAEYESDIELAIMGFPINYRQILDKLYVRTI